MRNKRRKFKAAIKFFLALFFISLIYFLLFLLFPMLKINWNDSRIMEATFNSVEFSENNNLNNTKAVIGDSVINIEIVGSDEARRRGLSGRENLDNNSGMFFVYTSDGYYGIWMKDMKFSIDIVWIDNKMNIIHIEEDIAPATYPKVFTPPRPARYILELPAGHVKKEGIKISDRVDLF